MRAPYSVAILAFAVAGLVALSAGCRDSNEPPTPTATVALTTTATATAMPTPSFEEEVGAAYLAYWDAYAAAVLNLDPTLVEGFATGEELDGIREEIETLRSQGVALRVVVEHDFSIVEAADGTATVFDEYVNNSFAVDPETGEPPTASGSGEVLRDAFFMERNGGRWSVVRSVRQQ